MSDSPQSRPTDDSVGIIPIADISSTLAEAQRQIDLLHAQLLQTQRLATIGTIAAVIAHEFNNLLTPVVSYSQYALESLGSAAPDTELIRKALTKAFNGAEKAGKICGSMLALARGEADFGPVDLKKLVDETLNVLARDPQKDGIALRVQVQPGLVARGDIVQLEQVLLNLLINSRQAMAGMGGTITIKCTPADPDPDCPPELRLQVIDTGPGIPEKLLPKIFTPFFTTKGTAQRGQSKGTGLGLAICKQIIEHHGGRIEVDSQLKKGTTFTLFLPAMPAAAQGQSSAAPAA